MRRTGMVLGLFGLTLGLAACPGDDSEGTGTDGETDMTTTGMTTMPSTTSPSTSTTTPTTDMTTMPMTTDMTTDVTSDTSTDTDPSATGTGTTGTADECTPCIEDNCAKELGACLGVEECGCWIECAAAMGTEKECTEMCGGPPPMRFGDLFGCIGRNCTDECSGGGTGTTGGMMDDGMYGACEMGECPGDLECEMALGTCTIDCQDPDECPAPSDGNAMPDCSGILNVCLLRCNDGETCPAGTDCTDLGGGNNVCTAN